MTFWRRNGVRDRGADVEIQRASQLTQLTTVVVYRFYYKYINHFHAITEYKTSRGKLNQTFRQPWKKPSAKTLRLGWV